jgi:hypothetical protein
LLLLLLPTADTRRPEPSNWPDNGQLVMLLLPVLYPPLLLLLHLQA